MSNRLTGLGDAWDENVPTIFGDTNSSVYYENGEPIQVDWAPDGSQQNDGNQIYYASSAADTGDNFDNSPDEGVRAVQHELNAYPTSLPRLREDGVWGGRTQARLEEFQQLHGLNVSGYLDDPTFALLDAAPSTSYTGGGQQTVNNRSTPGTPKPKGKNPFSNLTTQEKTVLGIAGAILVAVLVIGEAQ